MDGDYLEMRKQVAPRAHKVALVDVLGVIALVTDRKDV
jgi:hypothetical protein